MFGKKKAAPVLLELDRIEEESNEKEDTRTYDKKTGFPYSTYSAEKTLAKGLLDISLLMANVAQLKAMLNAGTSVEHFWFVVVVIGLSIVLQSITEIMLWVLGNMEVRSPEDKHRMYLLNRSTVGLITAITFVNILIGSFGIKISK